MVHTLALKSISDQSASAANLPWIAVDHESGRHVDTVLAGILAVPLHLTVAYRVMSFGDTQVIVPISKQVANADETT
jgi:hypothetical protein